MPHLIEKPRPFMPHFGTCCFRRMTPRAIRVPPPSHSVVYWTLRNDRWQELLSAMPRTTLAKGASSTLDRAWKEESIVHPQDCCSGYRIVLQCIQRLVGRFQGEHLRARPYGYLRGQAQKLFAILPRIVCNTANHPLLV